MKDPKELRVHQMREAVEVEVEEHQREVVGHVEEVLEEQQMEGKQSLLKVAEVELQRVVPEERSLPFEV